LGGNLFRFFKPGKNKETEIDAVAFSQGPGLAPCLLVSLKSKELSKI